MRRAFENAFAFLLRHAPKDAENLALPCFTLELLQPMEHLLLGFVANAAGVVEHQLGLLHLLHLRITLCEQSADDFFRVVSVHLTAERLNIEGLHGNYRRVADPKLTRAAGA